MGAHSDSPRSPGRGDFNGVCHLLDQCLPPAMPRDFEIGQGHSVPVGNERQACSIGSSTIFPGQGIVHRGDMRPSSLPPPHLARQTRSVWKPLSPPSIVQLYEICSGGPNFTTPHPPTVCRCGLLHQLEQFGWTRVPSSGTDRFCRCLKRRERHSGRGGPYPKSSSDILP